MIEISDYIMMILPSVHGFVVDVIFSLIVFFVGRKLIHIVRNIIRKALLRREVETGVQQFVDSFAKVTLYTILIIIIVGRFGVESSSIMAVIGSAGLTIGLALQGSLANFAGGVVILVNKPYAVGDYIVVDGGTHEGTVSEIRIFFTSVITIDGHKIVLPNGSLANQAIENVTGQKIRQIQLLSGISYQADIKKAKQILFELCQNDEKIMQEKPIEIFVNSLDESAVTIGTRIWVSVEDYWETKWRLLENIKLSFDEKGIEIPYNQLDVRVISAKE